MKRTLALLGAAACVVVCAAPAWFVIPLMAVTAFALRLLRRL